MICKRCDSLMVCSSLEDGSSLYTIDDRIVVDQYDPKHPEVVWFCDVCGSGVPVTAELPFVGLNGREYLTVCAMCLQNALNGIALSLSRPVSFDQPDGDVT